MAVLLLLPACRSEGLTTCCDHEPAGACVLEEREALAGEQLSCLLMAPSSAARPSPLPSSGHRRSRVFPPEQSPRRRLTGVVRAAPPVVRAAVGAITELLRALSPNKKPRDAVRKGGELEPPPCGSAEDVLAVLEDDYRRAYFLTGDFTPGIYAEDCLFEDPTIKFRGRSRYAQNPFLDGPSLELENIEKGSRVETKFIKATWILRTYSRLPWRPHIAIRGNTTYDLDEDYKAL